VGEARPAEDKVGKLADMRARDLLAGNGTLGTTKAVLVPVGPLEGAGNNRFVAGEAAGGELAVVKDGGIAKELDQLRVAGGGVLVGQDYSGGEIVGEGEIGGGKEVLQGEVNAKEIVVEEVHDVVGEKAGEEKAVSGNKGHGEGGELGHDAHLEVAHRPDGREVNDVSNKYEAKKERGTEYPGYTIVSDAMRADVRHTRDHWRWDQDPSPYWKWGSSESSMYRRRG